MSHIETVAVVVKDLDALKKATAMLGGQFVQGQTNYKWYGTERGTTRGIDGKCSHAITVPGVDYEVGVVREEKEGGYGLKFDSWGPGAGLVTKFGPKLNHLTDRYTAEALKRVAQRKGHRVQESLGKDGSIKLEVLQ